MGCPGSFNRKIMKQKLSVASRILVAFASGALIAVFFLPAWRIDLFAPQYPEGLTMNIWINGLSGEVDIINGLNHYIGMKHITVDMFPEFKFLPLVVGFFMLLGMIVAITGKRKFLFWYLVLTALGGIAAMIDFYIWGYHYGHNLDPTAPIQVPGLSYQPPIIGHKRILNFDAYSFPDAGGWIVIGAAVMAFTVWFVEWYLHHRSERKQPASKIPAGIIPLVILAAVFSSCSAKPEAFKFGVDNCYFCKMGIADPHYGAEIVTKKSKVYKFDDVVCMSRFLQAGGVEEKDIAKKLVINMEKENDFIETSNAYFLVDPSLKSPMGSNAAAFSSKQAAGQSSSKTTGLIITWDELINRLK